MIKFLPFIIFAVLAGFLYKGLSLNPSEVPSPFIGKLAPQIRGPELLADATTEFDSEQMAGQVWVLNVWASWCRECAYEHPLFVELAKQREAVPIIGLNYKDQTADASEWLKRFGNPYNKIVEDQPGRVGLDWGVYAVPETFVIDRQGYVRHKVIGPVSEEMMNKEILPLIDELLGAAS